MFHRLYSLLELECHGLDLLIAAHADLTMPADATPAFLTYTTTIQNIKTTKEQLSIYQNQVQFLDQTATLLAVNIPADQLETNVQLEVVRREAQNCRQKIHDMVNINTTVDVDIIHIYIHTYKHVIIRNLS